MANRVVGVIDGNSRAGNAKVWTTQKEAVQEKRIIDLCRQLTLRDRRIRRLCSRIEKISAAAAIARKQARRIVNDGMLEILSSRHVLGMAISTAARAAKENPHA